MNNQKDSVSKNWRAKFQGSDHAMKRVKGIMLHKRLAAWSILGLFLTVLMVVLLLLSVFNAWQGQFQVAYNLLIASILFDWIETWVGMQATEVLVDIGSLEQSEERV